MTDLKYDAIEIMLNWTNRIILSLRLLIFLLLLCYHLDDDDDAMFHHYYYYYLAVLEMG